MRQLRIFYAHEAGSPAYGAPAIHAATIIRGLRKKGHAVTDTPSSFLINRRISTIRQILNSDVLYIRIDGYNVTEKLSLLKLLKPKLKIIWEINGTEDELRVHFASYGNLRLRRLIFVRRLFRRMMAYFVNASICVSDGLRDYSRHRLHILNSVRIANGVDTGLFNPSRTTMFRGIDAKTYKVLWVGSGGYPWQGIDIIYKTAEKIYRRDRTVMFIIVSNDIWVTPNPPDNVILLRPMQHALVPRIVAASDICLYIHHALWWTSYEKYFSPFKLFEYMAMRKPVIASNKGHVPDIVSNSINGLLTDNSPDDICKKILYLKSNPYIAKAIGKKARDTVLRKYDWDTSISSINELLLSVTGHKNSHTGWTIMNHSFG